MKRQYITVIILMVALFFLAGNIFADDTICDSDNLLTNSKVHNVIAGYGCQMNGTNVKGNVKVEEGGTLFASAVKVDGNIQADGAARVTLVHVSVNGNVQIKKTNIAHLYRTYVKGNLQVEENESVYLLHDEVRQNLQIKKNTGRTYLSHNQVRRNLLCHENDPTLLAGSSNAVGGRKLGQCSDL